MPGWTETQSPTQGARAYLSRGGLRVLVSLDHVQDGTEWLHVSVSRRDRIPSYQDLIEVKDLFITPEREAIQVFPPRDKHVNDHPHCLHLWSRIDGPVMPDMRIYEPALGRLSI